MAQDSIKLEAFELFIETTPNPATLKFKLNRTLTETPKEFKNVEDSDHSPLAKKIWGFPWTASVYIGNDFVSITKRDWVSWDHLSRPLANMILNHIQKGEPIILETDLQLTMEDKSRTSLDSELVQQIKKILYKEIRPVVRLDGGDVEFSHFSNGTLAIQMKGACSGCPSAQHTLKNGIEARLCELFPEIKEVISV